MSGNVIFNDRTRRETADRTESVAMNLDPGPRRSIDRSIGSIEGTSRPPPSLSDRFGGPDKPTSREIHPSITAVIVDIGREDLAATRAVYWPKQPHFFRDEAGRVP